MLCYPLAEEAALRQPDGGSVRRGSRTYSMEARIMGIRTMGIQTHRPSYRLTLLFLGAALACAAGPAHAAQRPASWPAAAVRLGHVQGRVALGGGKHSTRTTTTRPESKPLRVILLAVHPTAADGSTQLALRIPHGRTLTATVTLSTT